MVQSHRVSQLLSLQEQINDLIEEELRAPDTPIEEHIIKQKRAELRARLNDVTQKLGLDDGIGM